MTQTPPTESPNRFLRIHRGPVSAAAAGSASQRGDFAAKQTSLQQGEGSLTRIDAADSATTSLDSTNRDAMDQLWDRFSDATGWKVTPASRRKQSEADLTPAINTSPDGTLSPIFIDKEIDEITSAEMDDIEDSFIDSMTHYSAVGRSAALDLANATLDLTKRLESSRQTVRRDQAELAARASVVATPEAQANLADRLETILSDAVMACDCDAAVIYMLDDDTSKLSARSVFGMSPSVIDKPARGLESSRTDIETMVRTVVMIDDVHATTIDTWNVPEPCNAAICAVINSGDVPIGTMWLFRNEATSFNHSHSASARMAARAIGVELTFAVSPEEDTTGKFASLVQPNEPVQLDEIDDELLIENFLSGLVEGLDDPVAEELDTEELDTDEPILGDFIADPVQAVAQWQHKSLPVGAEIAPGWKADGMIQSAADHAIGWHAWDVLPDGIMAIAMAEALDASITGAMNATVARSALASHLNYRHTPDQLLARIGDTMWQTSVGDQLVSLLYACVDPETGEGEIASAGTIHAIIANRYGYRPVICGDSDPLCMHIDTRSRRSSFRMTAGETLLAYSSGTLAGGITHTMLGGQLHDAMRSADQSPLSMIYRLVSRNQSGQEVGAITLARR